VRAAFEREMQAVLRYAQLALEPGTSKAEIQSLLRLARRRLADAAKVADAAEVGAVPAEPAEERPA
jgi:hypothetical protein